ncbi:hypothetical protein Tco_1462238, partial [Tanacetum coccineum]
MTLLLCSVIVPPSMGNFNIPCAVNGTAWIFLMPGLPIIALCWDGDLITMKFIHAEVSGGRNHLIPYLFAEFYEAMFIQDFFDDHWALRPVFFPQRWKRHFRLRREALGNPGLGHSFPWLDHQYSQ